MTRSHLVALAALIVIAVVPACGAPSPAGGSAAANSPALATTGSAASSGGASDDGAGGVAYVPWGPADPPVPDQYTALAASPGSAPRCDDAAAAQPDEPFWATAAAVCRALTTGAGWPTSRTVPAPPAPENAFEACLDDELAAMLQRALRWHADHPGERPEVAFPAPASRSPCQFQIYRTAVVEPAAPDDTGRVRVEVTAAGIDDDGALEVTVDGERVEPLAAPDVPDPGVRLRTLVVEATAQEQPRTVQIELTTSDGTRTASVDLPGRAGADPSPPESTSSATGQSASTP